MTPNINVLLLKQSYINQQGIKMSIIYSVEEGLKCFFIDEYDYVCISQLRYNNRGRNIEGESAIAICPLSI